jgi:hypothetical protein
MKNLIVSMVLSAMFAVSLSADYKLILTDKDGVQTEECIKSYSFSNNLESIAKQKGVTQDIYSEEEVMTNKVYLGKPVYRKVEILTGFVTGDWKMLGFNFDTSIIEKLVNAEVDFNGSHERYTHVGSSTSYFRYFITKNGLQYTSSSAYVNSTMIATVIIEYTKNADVADSSSNTFKSYLHYVPSSSATEELINVDMKNIGVQFLEGYTYDSATNSCNPN